MVDVSSDWVKYFTGGTDIVRRVFANTLGLFDIQLNAILRDYHKSQIVLCFNSTSLPEQLPKKWKEKNIEAISFDIVMTQLAMLNLRAEGMGFVCTPNISQEGPLIHFSIHHKHMELSCKSNDLRVYNLTPVFK